MDDFVYYEKILDILFQLKYSNIKVYIISNFNLYNIKNPSNRELEIINIFKTNKPKLEKYKLYEKYVKEILEKQYDEKSIDELYYNIPCTIYKDNDFILNENISRFYNVVNGRRFTEYAPNQYENIVHIFGHSIQMGYYTEDKYTISSQLQKKLNEKYNNKFKVINYGVQGINGEQLYNKINNIQFKKNDIIIFNRFNVDFCENNNITYIDIARLFDRPHNYGEIFMDMMHLNSNALGIIADKIFKCILNNEFELKRLNKSLFDNNKTLKIINKNKNIMKEDFKELDEYIKYLNQFKVDKKVIGSIVINANPFTNGHLYLIEKALSMVDWLYIFVVEENRSFFDFKDRIHLTIQCTKHLKNVTVIRSGKYIISNLTFPDYFLKDNNIIIDSSLDIEIFVQYICKTLNIKKRFVGSEPFDNTTYQYNEQLKSKLKLYNIELIELSRKTYNDHPISASIIREKLINNNLKDIKNMVPNATYNFLLAYNS